MNSRAALLGALDRGMDGIELDVQLSADGILVAFHDEVLDDRTNCHGRVNALPWNTLSRCGYSASTGEHQPIVRVDSLLVQAVTLHPTTSFTLDCKLFAAGDWWSYLESFSDAIAHLSDAEILNGRLLAECRVDEFLRLLQRKTPTLPLYLYADDADTAMRIASEAGYAGITMHHGRMDRDQVEQAKALGLRVTLFGTGNWWSEQRALQKTPDQLQTDRVPVR